MNTTLSSKGDRQANHEAFSGSLSPGNNVDPVVLLSQLFELERLQFQRMEDGLEPPSTRAIRRWIRFEGRQEFGKLIVVHPPKTNWNGLAYLSLNISFIHKHVVNK
jgi:hypothetical protein